jgi:hypothetical protein
MLMRELFTHMTLNLVFCISLNLGIVKVIDGNWHTLSEAEFKQVSVFTLEVIHLSEEEPTGMTLAQKAMNNKRRKTCTNPNFDFINLDFIPPTSNVVERLFSSARLVLTDYRKSMSPYTFECVMFLKFNSCLWDISTVSKVVGK